MIEVDCYLKAYLYTYVNDYIRMYFYECIHIVTCVFIINLYIFCLILQQKNLVYRRFLDYVASA